MKTKNLIFIVLMALGFVFTSCGGGGGGDSAPATLPTSTTITGIFLDDPVEGLDYECSSGTVGVTNAKGEYTCMIGDNVTFTLGNVTLGETYSSSIITPYTLFPSDKDGATNLVRLLHSIDENNSAGQILIGKNFILPTDLNFSSPTFDNDVSSSIVKPLMTSSDAMLLLDDNLGRKSGTEIYHNGFWYNTMSSSVTGRIWLDRDLGAKSVCSDYNDTTCYGEFYQWGRDTDGHEKRDSLISYDFPADVDNAGNKFIIDTLDWLGYDANGSLREEKWSNLNGESVCPVNFRVPTQQEFKDENILAANFTLNNTVTNVLKLATAGERDLDKGIVKEGELGTYWTGESYKRVVGGSWQYSVYPYVKYQPGTDVGYEGTRAIGKNVRCIMEEEIIHNEVNYMPIKSPSTGRVWLDRNVGATKACASKTDTACYGGLYQWGRDTDGHEISTSLTSTIIQVNYLNIGDKFIIWAQENGWQSDWTIGDVGGVKRAARWSSIDGSSICPVGFRVPTIDEIEADTSGSASQTEAYNKFLNLPIAGYRDSYGNVKFNSNGYLWSTALGGFRAMYFGGVQGEFAWLLGAGANNNGQSVRCIKD